MGKEFRLKLEKLFDFLGEVLAFVTALAWALVIINANFNFLPEIVKNIVGFEIVFHNSSIGTFNKNELLNSNPCEMPLI